MFFISKFRVTEIRIEDTMHLHFQQKEASHETNWKTNILVDEEAAVKTLSLGW